MIITVDPFMHQKHFGFSSRMQEFGMEPTNLQCVSCSEPGETKWILCDDDQKNVHILVYFNYHTPSMFVARIDLM